MGSTLDTIAPIALAVIGSAFGAPELGLTALQGGALGAGLGSAGVNYSKTHNFGDALKAGALGGGGAYLGGNIANSVLGSQLGTVGSTLGISPDAASSDIASFGNQAGSLPWSSVGAGSSNIASALGGAAASGLSTPVSTAIGSTIGSNLASSYAPQPTPPGAPQFSPNGVGIGAMPGSLNSMASLTPQQQASSLATQGAYGGGLGRQEQGYFGNLVQNQLNPSAGKTNDLSSLSPIENNYLGQLGFGSYGNSGSPNDLLKALSTWNPSA